MPRIQAFLIVLLTLVLALSAAGKTTGRKKQRKAPPPAPPVEPQPAPIVDLPPPTPEQGPSSPPEVSFQNGQLTIEARNSTMSDVLVAVKRKTGAAVEMPTVSNERVVGKFGPGAPRDVMAQLLNGSHYDYVLLGSPQDPQALEKVVLMARVSGPQPNVQPEPPPANPVTQFNQPLSAVPDVDADTQDDSGNETPVMPPDVQGQDDQSQQPERGPMVRSPEQLLRELQQQQLQQQQQQEPNVPPATPGQPPQ